jgi:hypothetical protein
MSSGSEASAGLTTARIQDPRQTDQLSSGGYLDRLRVPSRRRGDDRRRRSTPRHCWTNTPVFILSTLAAMGTLATLVSFRPFGK